MRRRFINNHKTFDYSKYMTIEVLEDGYEVYFNRDVEYNLNGYKWVLLKAGLVSPTLKKGDLLSLRCSLTPDEILGPFQGNGKAINLRGNILSLIFKDDINLDISHYKRTFYGLFSYYNGNNIVSVEKNFLPATTLAYGCYYDMFNGCINLTTAPELPATTLESYCYHSMFKDCTSLTTVPELPATTLATGCYHSMFYHCTNLTTAPKLPVTTLTSSCYESMFFDCTSLTTAPELPATTLADSCYDTMFQGCTKLTTAPELPATTLKRYCYNNMFRGCTSLNYIKMLATDISAIDCLYNWVNGVAKTGTFVKNPAMTSLPTGWSGIPSGWTVVDDGEE